MKTVFISVMRKWVGPVAVAVLVALNGCSSGGGGGASGRLAVIAAENFWGNIAAQLGGSHVQVTSIISDPSADPHLYESDPRDAAAVGSADVVIKNGLGYDDFIDRLLNAHSSAHRRVVSAAAVLGRSGTTTNPHLWYDTPRVPAVAAAIAAQFEAADPVHAADYKANLRRFDAALEPVLAVIDTIRSKYAHAPVAYTERVPEYLLRDAGLDVRTPSGFANAIEGGSEPSPADRAAMQSLLTDHRVKVLLYNSQATSPVTKHVQDTAHAAGIEVLPVTETIPHGEPSFQSWQLDQATALLRALGG
jgi:zinc/manganese transport system substrate-binding protein